MIRRVLVAELKTETATFNPWPTTFEDFRVYRGQEILERYRGTLTEISGAIDILQAERAIEIITTVAADAVSGGRIRTQCLDRLIGEIIDSARKNNDVDAAFICLHGAMAGQDEDDPEGRLLAELRSIFGPKPVVVSLDLHAVLTDRMIENADILVPFHTYPHIDQYETGQRSARCLLRLMSGGTRPSISRIKLPMLVRGDELLTKSGRFGEAVRMCQQIERDPRALAAGVIIGNAFTDVRDLQSNVIVTVDEAVSADASSWASDQALTVARFMWQHRKIFQAQLVPLDNALRLASQTQGLTVFSDAADATASGAAGDSNAILVGLLNTNFPKKSLVPIVDAPAVAAAFAAGIGATIVIALGGTRDPGRFSPFVVQAKVKSLHDGQFTYENGTVGNAGRVAVLCAGCVTIMVTERSVYIVGRKVFDAYGLDPRQFDLVVVKSPNGFRTWYESIAARIVPIDVPGSTSANLKSLPFQHCVRPIFPLDENVIPGFSLE